MSSYALGGVGVKSLENISMARASFSLPRSKGMVLPQFSLYSMEKSSADLGSSVLRSYRGPTEIKQMAGSC